MVVPEVTPERWRRLDDLFAAAAELSGAARIAFLDDACGADRGLRAEVEALLASVTKADGVLHGAIAAAASSMATDASLDQVGRTLGPYRVVALLGEGGMGTVYLAERDDGQYRRKVAIKIL